jgi:prevent-host-death family protein
VDQVINTKTLRLSLPEILRRVRRGERFTVLHRSRPAFRVVPLSEAESIESLPLAKDPIYRAGPVGRSADGLTSMDHDRLLYGQPSR